MATVAGAHETVENDIPVLLGHVPAVLTYRFLAARREGVAVAR